MRHLFDKQLDSMSSNQPKLLMGWWLMEVTSKDTNGFFFFFGGGGRELPTLPVQMQKEHALTS